MDSLQQQYWAIYEEAVELLQTKSERNVERGTDLCLNLRDRIDIGLLLRALVNYSLAMYSESVADQVQYSNECLDLATMLQEQNPDDETAAVLNMARELVQTIKDHAEEEGVDLDDIQQDNNISWEGQFTKAWKASKETREKSATATASSPAREVDTDTAGESQSTVATTVIATDDEVGSEPTETDEADKGDDAEDTE
ncbi:hypothetical protein PV08_11097 [Exophiala spinifera]|uniref:Uncharacterized protein n=1 Tax=Exophiala spinifera TaxID=91928 RepID=A0A0D1Y5D2_9EURO|nr:uncharacterized protein PV08_11097 [Exophiala spinifera]KIW10136.1 hypothetical protein PV08_11097 [Exophiala spinifera]